MEAMVSVIIPAHNSERYLQATIDSVLSQKHRPLEVVVVDDGSTDATAEIVRRYSNDIRLIQQEQKGHPAARNVGINATRGEFLGFVDHDDLWSSNKLELQLECFEKDPALDLVFGHIQNFLTPEMSDDERGRIRAPLHPLPGLLQGAMPIRRKSFLMVGLFDENRSIGDFLDWYGRAMLAGRTTCMLDETLLFRRIHSGNFQRANQHRRGEYLRAVKDLLDRRRGVVS